MSAAAPALKTPPAPAVMTGARLLVSSLERMGVEVVFGYPGGAIMPIYDALTGSSLKHILVRDAAEIPAVIEQAFHIAASGRPGPVLVDLPKDVQFAETVAPFGFNIPNETTDADPDAIAEAERFIRAAQRPLIYIGGGVKIGRATEALRAFAETTGMPAVATLNALGTVPTDAPGFLGMLGMHGTRAANEAVQASDLLIVMGARFDDRATGKLAEFAPHARVVHFDVDASEIGKLRETHVAVGGEIRPAIEALTALMAAAPLAIDPWVIRCASAAERHAARYDAPGEGVVAACDVGQHQMWAAQHCRFARPEAHITSGGLGAMGFGLPAGLGAQMADPDAVVVTIAGDGGFMMNVQELATLRRYGVPLKIVLLDNSSLGLVRQWQELFFSENYSEIDLSDNPDFVKVAEAFGIEAFRIDRRDQVEAGLARLLAAKGACLAHVVIDPKENVWPLVPPGKSNAEMMEGA